jgi:hypothetical protein
MDSTQAALVFFFGTFWACVLSAVAPFQTFDTRLVFRPESRRRGICRIMVGLVVVNVVPVFGLCLLYKSWLMDAKDVKGVAVAATAAMSVFSIQRFLHAFIATKSLAPHFYSDADVNDLKERGKDVDQFHEHFIPAVGYVVIPLLLAGGLHRYWPSA